MFMFTVRNDKHCEQRPTDQAQTVLWNARRALGRRLLGTDGDVLLPVGHEYCSRLKTVPRTLKSEVIMESVEWNPVADSIEHSRLLFTVSQKKMCLHYCHNFVCYQPAVMGKS